MNIKKVAEISNITVRTLHYYDEIKLLSPSRNDENGYREYSEGDLNTLQQILLFKECGFQLSKIKTILENPSFNREEGLLLQKKYLIHEKKNIESMLTNIDKTLKSIKGGCEMKQEEKFEGFDFSNNPYEEEARKLWGDKRIEESKDYIKSLSKEEKESIENQMNELFYDLAKIRNEDLESEIVQKAMDNMYNHFNENFNYCYSLDAFANLGDMYISDARFTKNIDKYGEGLSQFLAKAMKIYVKNKSK